jgi:hypothetical protein
MRVGGKSMTRLDAILVDDAQTAKVRVRRIVILVKRESVISIQPPKIEVPAILLFANIDNFGVRRPVAALDSSQRRRERRGQAEIFHPFADPLNQNWNIFFRKNRQLVKI